ncbi:galactose-3-O-sulfotransferase 3-like [Esox lucius]|uniref:Galactose-3-O-sulfotransferase 3 n=1 Tax=Esox lucius TaxID=8010 RepID=A0A3P8XRT7_ESOLU|nr:galactose-3-O-sulfotransferase 3-like [Esox lucius]
MGKLFRRLVAIVVTVSAVLQMFYVITIYSMTKPNRAFPIGCPSNYSHRSSSLRPKHTNVAFLKTHKTASSTMQNLLHRFAERNNLTVALPNEACDFYQFCYPRNFSAHFVHEHTLQPNMITSHMRFNLAELRRLMPNNTQYVTILREPGSMFESLFSYYYEICPSFKRVPNGSLEAFLDNPWRYYRPDEDESMYARNTLTFDLGGDKDRLEVDLDEYAQAFVAEIEHVFSLVMITEHFDESLVLFRHLLSWDVEDILYVKLNMRTPSSKRRFSPGIHAKVRAWNALDARLYDHFNASLWRQLAVLGPELVAREVNLLHRAQERLVKDCFGDQLLQLRLVAQIKNNKTRPWVPDNEVGILGYELPTNTSLPHNLCLKLIMPEHQYSDDLLLMASHRKRRSTPSTVTKLQ